MSDVVAPERAGGPTPSRLSRIRCTHCAMPAGGRQATCWSCGLDPAGPADAGALPRRRAAAELARPWHTALLAASAATLLLVALLGTVLMLDPRESGQGPRGIAARIRGDGWLRAGVGGATAEFPSRPDRSTVPASGATGTADVLVATAPGLRVELRASRLEGPLPPAAVADAYATATGQQVRRTAPVALDGGAGLDALLEGAEGATRVRAVVTASSAYLLAVTGPPAAFQRAVASFTAGS